MARPICPGVDRPGSVVVDNFAEEVPIARRELDVIETYLGELLDDVLEALK
jgi:hypothetical protein